MDTIYDRFNQINEHIQKLLVKYGRNPDYTKLVVVTKKQPIAKIIQVINAGATILGENYPEEGYEKFQQIAERHLVQWHMIGHIQSRKTKYILQFCSCVHTIDRLKIGVKLHQESKIAGMKLPVMLEVNFSGEESKFGFKVHQPEGKKQLYHTVDHLLQCDSIELQGLMTMPPFTSKAEESRSIFQQCRALSEDIQKQFNLPSFSQLSMGTSQDYEIAIQEGATYLRIGEAIMGKRESL